MDSLITMYTHIMMLVTVYYSVIYVTIFGGYNIARRCYSWADVTICILFTNCQLHLWNTLNHGRACEYFLTMKRLLLGPRPHRILWPCHSRGGGDRPVAGASGLHASVNEYPM